MKDATLLCPGLKDNVHQAGGGMKLYAVAVNGSGGGEGLYSIRYAVVTLLALVE